MCSFSVNLQLQEPRARIIQHFLEVSYEGDMAACVPGGVFRGGERVRRRAIAAQSAQARGGFERTLTVNGPVDLYVRTGSGSIQVRTGSADRVQIIGRVTASAWRDSTDAAERVKRVESAPPITQAGNVIRLGDTRDDPMYRNVSISYELIVPANTSLNAHTGSGNQTVGSLDGEERLACT